MVLLEVIVQAASSMAQAIGAHPILFTVFVGIPLAFYILTMDFTTARLPPRFSYLVPMVTGKFKMKEWGPVKFIQEGYNQHGDIFRIKIANKGITFLIGPEANKFFYNTSDKILTAREVYHFTVPVFGPNIVYDAPLPLMQRQLSFLRKALNGKNMQTYVNKVRKECDTFFSQFPEKGTMHLHKVFSELIINTASRCLMGDEVRETLNSEVADIYEHLNDGMTRLSLLFPYSPHPKHKKRDEAREAMVKMFEPIIGSRRERRAKGEILPDDFLQNLCDCHYENRRQLTVVEIVGLLIACLFAGQHTSNITATWLGALIAHHKKTILPRLIQEQRDVLGDNFLEESGNVYDGLSYDSVQEMELLHFSIKETLRLFPPIVVMMRTVQEPQTFREYTIPAGDIVVTSPAVSHRIPTVFKNPEQFDPDRFLKPRCEGEDVIDDKGDVTKQWQFIAFGEGLHQCIGRDFAFLQVKTIYSYLFHHFDFDAVSDTFIAKQNFDTLVAGPGCDCNMNYRRVNLVAEAAKVTVGDKK